MCSIAFRWEATCFVTDVFGAFLLPISVFRCFRETFESIVSLKLTKDATNFDFSISKRWKRPLVLLKLPFSIMHGDVLKNFFLWIFEDFGKTKKVFLAKKFFFEPLEFLALILKNKFV